MADVDFSFYDRPATAVEDNLAEMNQRADSLLSESLAAIAALGSFSPEGDPDSPLNLTLPPIIIPSPVVPVAPTGTTFGAISTPGDPSFEDVANISGDTTLTIQPGQFSPTVGAPAFPSPLGPMDISGDPGAPPAVTAPTLATYTRGTIPPDPNFITINPPTFAGIDPPTFSDDPVSFDGASPRLTLTAPPPYDSNYAATVSEWIGSGGLPAVLQQALFDAARSREDQTAYAAIQDSFDTWAARGFSMPPGMLVESVSIAQERARFAVSTLNRDLAARLSEQAMANIGAAVSAGIALEAALIASHDRAAQLTFEAAKGQAEIETKLYDVAVALFNAKQAARQLNATIYRAEWDGEVAKVQAFKAEVDAEVAKGQVNDHLARAYTAQWEGVKAAADAYNTAQRGVQIGAEAEKTAIEAWATSARGYGDVLQARKVQYDAWAESMRGEASKATAYAAQASAFADTVRAQGHEASVRQDYTRLQIEGVRASTEQYRAKLELNRDTVAAELANIQARARAFEAETARYGEEIKGSNQARLGEIQVAELRLRNTLAYFDATIKSYDAAQSRQIERHKVVVGAIDGAARATSTLAAGAMSAIHVSASMGGTGSVSVTNSTNRNQKLPDL